jgi:hypothetical protein
MRRILFWCLVCTITPAVAVEQDDEWEDWPLGSELVFSANAFVPNLATTVRVDASDGTPGTVISFEQALGLSDTETLPSFSFSWRFAKKHRLGLGYFSLNRSGSAVAETEIRFGDEVFEVDLPISTFFDTNVMSLGYSYSFIFDEKKQIALSVGVSVQDITFGLRGDAGANLIEAESGVTAPLPAFGISGGYAFTEKWTLRGSAGLFSFKLAVDDEDDLQGQIVDASLGLYHHTFEHVHFGASYSYFDVAADFGNKDNFNSLDYRYHGPMLTVSAVF